MSVDFVGIQEIVAAARENLEQPAWDYLVGWSESETTLRRNRQGFDRLALRHRILIDVSKVDASTTLLGHKMRIPVMLAPVGSLQRFHPDGAAASTRAAKEFGTLHTLSSVSDPSLEDVAACGDNPRIYQLYIRGDFDWIKEWAGRAKKAGYVGLAICVDNPTLSRRERVVISRAQLVAGASRVQAAGPAAGPRWGSMVTWELLDRIKDFWKGPVLVKGVFTPEDASLCVDHGVDVVWVSNHGGRQLDHEEGTIEVLPEIAAAVAGRAQIVLDGGIQRGTDVLKALALGANAVAIGKLQGWALGAAGQEGVLRLFELLEEEILIDMGLLGITNWKQINPTYIHKVEPVTPPHEMSGWVHLPGGRLL